MYLGVTGVGVGEMYAVSADPRTCIVWVAGGGGVQYVAGVFASAVMRCSVCLVQLVSTVMCQHLLGALISALGGFGKAVAAMH